MLLLRNTPFRKHVDNMENIIQSIRLIFDSMMADGDKWPYILIGSVLTLIAITQCVVKLSAWVKDYGYAKQKERLDRLTVLKNARQNNPEILLDAEIDAVVEKLNEYDAWRRWQQERTETAHISLSEKKCQKNFSIRFALIYSFFLLILWGILPLLKAIGLFTPEDGSILSNFSIGNVIIPFTLNLAIVWIFAYFVAYYLYKEVKKSDDPVSRWFFSWMSTSLLFSAMIAVTVENSSKYTGKFLLAEFALNAIVVLLVLLGFTVGRGCNYVINRMVFSTRLSDCEQYHTPLSTSQINSGFARSNILFWAVFSISFELLYSGTTITNSIMMLIYIGLCLLSFFSGPICFLVFIYCIVLGDGFAFHGHKVTFYMNTDKWFHDKEERVIVDKDGYPTNPNRENYSFKGWEQRNNKPRMVKLDELLPREKCGKIELHAQWQELRH